MIVQAITKMSRKEDLTYEEMRAAMSEMLDGRIPVEETASFLRGLASKGESDCELLAMLDVMQEHTVLIEPHVSGRLIDVCGTGGDGLQTFNVSTAAAFVAAASGVGVAKHGNRSSSGISGSADIFEHFGYDLTMGPDKVCEIIERFRIGFMFAQTFHPAMKNVAAARKAVGKRTAFNLLGPLSNPARVRHQLVGVFSPSFLQRVPSLLRSRGSENVITVISADGLDEFSTTSKNMVCQMTADGLRSFVLDPAELGLGRAEISDIQVATRDEAVKAFVHALDGTGKRATVEVAALNAAAALIVGGKADGFPDALDTATEAISSGRSFELFKEFFRHCGDMGKVEEAARS